VRLLFLLALFICTSISIQAQNNAGINDSIISDSTIYYIVDILPEFPGGELKLNEFIRENLVYPEKALKMNIQGRVYISFVVEKDGSLTNLEILKGIGYGCDEEVLRLVKSMPKWIPGYEEGEVKRFQYYLPAEFKLVW
jgi:protein TonB